MTDENVDVDKFEYSSDEFTGFENRDQLSKAPKLGGIVDGVAIQTSKKDADMLTSPWTCTICAAINPDELVQCGACESLRGNGSTGPVKSDATSDDAPWACTTCTLRNAATQVVCAACGISRLSSETPRRVRRLNPSTSLRFKTASGSGTRGEHDFEAAQDAGGASGNGMDAGWEESGANPLVTPRINASMRSLVKKSPDNEVLSCKVCGHATGSDVLMRVHFRDKHPSNEIAAREGTRKQATAAQLERGLAAFAEEQELHAAKMQAAKLTSLGYDVNIDVVGARGGRGGGRGKSRLMTVEGSTRSLNAIGRNKAEDDEADGQSEYAQPLVYKQGRLMSLKLKPKQQGQRDAIPLKKPILSRKGSATAAFSRAVRGRGVRRGRVAQGRDDDDEEEEDEQEEEEGESSDSEGSSDDEDGEEDDDEVDDYGPSRAKGKRAVSGRGRGKGRPYLGKRKGSRHELEPSRTSSRVKRQRRLAGDGADSGDEEGDNEAEGNDGEDDDEMDEMDARAAGKAAARAARAAKALTKAPREKPVLLTETELRSLRTTRLEKLLSDTANIMGQMSTAVAVQQSRMAENEAKMLELEAEKEEVAGVKTADGPGRNEDEGMDGETVQPGPVPEAQLGPGGSSSLLTLSPIPIRALENRQGLDAGAGAGSAESLVPSSMPIVQPALIHGARMREYQVKGLQWLVSLHDAKLNGLLADEMGLGKTLQILAFMAYLAESRKSYGPYLIVVPLSVLKNWKADAAKFCPELASRMHLHHGSDQKDRKDTLVNFLRKCRGWKKEKTRRETEALDLAEAVATARQHAKRLGKAAMDQAEAEVTPLREYDDDDKLIDPLTGQAEIGLDPRLGELAIVVTTYDIALRDASLLRHAPEKVKLRWQYLIVDEGHRLKNKSSKLGEALRTMGAPRRLLLTGTPLQNDLKELWALLNFCLPDLFNSEDSFNDWFAAPFENVKVVADDPDDPAARQRAEAAAAALDVTDEEKSLIVNRLHAVLRPFLLRRTKSEVLSAADLTDRTEIVLRVPMSAVQAALYERIRRGLRDLIDPVTGVATKSLNLSNVMMQLRKISIHPFLLADEYSIDAELVRSSGKFEVLHRLLPKLLSAGHRVLIFSQMTKVLDLIEDLLALLGLANSWARLDGSTRLIDRTSLLKDFNKPDSTLSVFLLSTRAGGVGINLQSADTVIIFDSDWNPQMDLQAQARAHRLGQTKEVRVIRLLSTGPPVFRQASVHPSPSSSSSSSFSSHGPDGPWGCLRGVEDVMHMRAGHKLDTETQVIADGRFHHGSVPGVAGARGAKGGADDGTPRSSDDGQGEKESKSTVAAQVLAQCMVDDGAGGDQVGAGGALGPIPSLDGRVNPFDTVPDAFLNKVCARDEFDSRCFRAWDGVIADEVRQRVLDVSLNPSLLFSVAEYRAYALHLETPDGQALLARARSLCEAQAVTVSPSLGEEDVAVCTMSPSHMIPGSPSGAVGALAAIASANKTAGAAGPSPFRRGPGRPSKTGPKVLNMAAASRGSLGSPTGSGAARSPSLLFAASSSAAKSTSAQCLRPRLMQHNELPALLAAHTLYGKRNKERERRGGGQRAAVVGLVQAGEGVEGEGQQVEGTQALGQDGSAFEVYVRAQDKFSRQTGMYLDEPDAVHNDPDVEMGSTQGGGSATDSQGRPIIRTGKRGRPRGSGRGGSRRSTALPELPENWVLPVGPRRMRAVNNLAIDSNGAYDEAEEVMPAGAEEGAQDGKKSRHVAAAAAYIDVEDDSFEDEDDGMDSDDSLYLGGTGKGQRAGAKRAARPPPPDPALGSDPIEEDNSKYDLNKLKQFMQKSSLTAEELQRRQERLALDAQRRAQKRHVMMMQATKSAAFPDQPLTAAQELIAAVQRKTLQVALHAQAQAQEQLIAATQGCR